MRSLPRLADRDPGKQGMILIRALFDEFGPAPLLEAVGRIFRGAAVGRGLEARRTAAAIVAELEGLAARIRGLRGG